MPCILPLKASLDLLFVSFQIVLFFLQLMPLFAECFHAVQPFTIEKASEEISGSPITNKIGIYTILSFRKLRFKCSTTSNLISLVLIFKSKSYLYIVFCSANLVIIVCIFPNNFFPKLTGRKIVSPIANFPRSPMFIE